MSEPTLYRIDPEKLAKASELFQDFVRHQIDNGLLVPVEPCEHGNISEHIICHEVEPGWFEVEGSCPGAGIGDSDE